MRKGIFITIEGGEGAGKSTIIARIAEALEAEGHPVLLTREPGGIDIAEQIRAIVLDRKNTSMDPRTEALLYAAARRQHLVEKVQPALEKGMVVLCDRFVDSSLAYQGYARGIGVEEVFSINQFAIDNCLPDVTLYFDVLPEVGLGRINANKEREVNRLDLEATAFHEKVREAYLALAKRFSERIVVIDANQPIEKVFMDAQKILQPKLNQSK